MREGHVDETWAKEYHSVWYDEQKRGGKSVLGGAMLAGVAQMREKT